METPAFAALIPEAPLVRLGAVGSQLAVQLVQASCSDPNILQQLPRTCSIAAATELQPQLLRDLMRLPKRWLPTGSPSDSAQRITWELLEVLSERAEPDVVAVRLAQQLGYVGGAGCTLPVVAPDDRLGTSVLALLVATRRLRDEASASAADVKQRLHSQLTRALAAQRVAADRIAPLVDAALAARAAHRRYQTQPARESLSALLRADLDLWWAASAVAGLDPGSAPQVAADVVAAFADGDPALLSGAIQRALAEQASLRGQLFQVVTDLLRLLQAESEAEAQRIVRNVVLGVGPWLDGWIFGASAGVPVFNTDNVSLVGDAQLGYNGGEWGLVAGGGATVIEFDSATFFESTAKFYGGGEGWYGVTVDRSTFELRATLNVIAFDSDTTAIGSDGIVNASETTLHVRGGGLLGARWQAEHLALGLWAGASRQIEFYDQLATNVASGSTIANGQEITSGSWTFAARSRVQWQLLPQWLSLRVAANVHYFHLARTTDRIDFTASEPFVQVDESARQLETSGRAFVDVEALRWFEFVPSLGGGVDYYRLAIEGLPQQQALIPVVMLGVRRTTF